MKRSRTRTWAGLVHDTISSTGRTVRALLLLTGLWLASGARGVPPVALLEAAGHLVHR